VCAKIENRIADQLARPVKRDVPTALDFEDIDPSGLEQMGSVRIPAQRNYRRMLEQQEHIVLKTAGDSIFGEVALPRESFVIRHIPAWTTSSVFTEMRYPCPGLPTALRRWRTQR